MDEKRMTMWLAPNVEGAKPYVRATSTANVWEFVWPDASGNGNDAVMPLRPEDVAEAIAERDRLAARVQVLEGLARRAFMAVGMGYEWSEEIGQLLGIEWPVTR
jgi:hypothetical protein